MENHAFLSSDTAIRLAEKLGLKNRMAVPRLKKIVINACYKEALGDKKVLEAAIEQIAVICGQRPIIRRAKKAIAGFKLRAGDEIATMVTLRGKRMDDFFERLTKITLPRVKDFHGVSCESFDGKGNYSLGLREQAVFPEIDYGKIDKLRGLEITIVTSAGSDKSARILLEEMGMPFKKG